MVLGVASYLVFYYDDCFYCERETERCNESWWWNVLFINNFRSPICLTWTWSIAVEWQMYLISPFVVLFVSWRPRYSILFLSSIALLSIFLYVLLDLYTGVISPDSDFVEIVYTKPYTRMFAYFYGMIVAVHVREEANYLKNIDEGKEEIISPAKYCFFFQTKDPRQDKTFNTVLNWRRFLAIIGLLVTLFISPLDPFFHDWVAYLFLPLFCLFAAYILYDTVSPFCAKGIFHKVLSWILSTRVLYVIAQLSYSMYLIHVTIMFPIFDLIGQSLDSIRFHFGVYFLAFLLFTACSAAVSILVYFAIEKPMINLAHVFFSKKKF